MSQSGKGRRPAAVYTRYSSDLQSAKSTKDQIAVCRIYAERNGLDVMKVYSDEAVSGTSLKRRDAWRQLMVDAEAERFSVVIAEHVDRISRNVGDYHRESEALESFGVELHTMGGRLGFMEGGVNALVAANFSRELGPKVHRGQAGNIAEGRLAGSFTYGYCKVRGYPGEPEIDEAKATIVRRIFVEAKAGMPARSIAKGLNDDGVPGPRGGKWNGSTINGNRHRATGILHNQLYVGRIVWNRADASKVPGKRRKNGAKLRDKAEWMTAERPSLRIIDDATFEAVQDTTPHIMRTTNRKRTKYLFSGLMRCGECGGGMVANGANKAGRVHVRCSSYTDSGGCRHGRRYYLDEIENRSLDGLKAELAEPVLIRHYIDGYAAEVKRLANTAAPRRKKLEARKRDLEKSLAHYVDAIGDGSIPLRQIADKMASIEADIAEIQAALTEAEPTPIALLPATAKSYLAKIEKLGHDTLSRDTESSAIIRDLLESVTILRTPKGEAVRLRLNGYLERLRGPVGGHILSPSGRSEQTCLTFS